MPNRIYKLRKKTGLKQSELASKVGISQQTLSRIENEISEPAIDVLCALSDYFNVSIDYLMLRTTHIQMANSEDEVNHLVIENYELLNVMKKLTNKEKYALLQIAKVLSSDSIIE